MADFCSFTLVRLEGSTSKQHQRKLLSSFRTQLKAARVICLGIPDDYRFMQPELVAVLEKKVGPYLR